MEYLTQSKIKTIVKKCECGGQLRFNTNMRHGEVIQYEHVCNRCKKHVWVEGKTYPYTAIFQYL